MNWLTGWIKIDPSKFVVESQPPQSGDVAIKIFFSPYDLPEALRFGAESDFFIIEFRYIATESLHEERRDDGVILQVGKKSKRIYGMKVPIRLLQQSDNYLVPAMERWSYVQPDTRMREVYKITEQALTSSLGAMKQSIQHLTPAAFAA